MLRLSGTGAYPLPVLHIFRITHASEVAGLQFALNERNRMEALC